MMIVGEKIITVFRKIVQLLEQRAGMCGECDVIIVGIKSKHLKKYKHMRI